MASLTDCQKSPVQPRMCRQAGRFVLFRVDGDLLPPLFLVLQLGVQIGVHPLEAGQHPLDLLAGVLHLLLGLADVVQHCPVGEQIVKK